eukprot:909764-Prymnesium_polylepis.1
MTSACRLSAADCRRRPRFAPGSRSRFFSTRNTWLPAARGRLHSRAASPPEIADSVASCARAARLAQ